MKYGTEALYGLNPVFLANLKYKKALTLMRAATSNNIANTLEANKLYAMPSNVDMLMKEQIKAEKWCTDKLEELTIKGENDAESTCKKFTFYNFSVG